MFAGAAHGSVRVCAVALLALLLLPPGRARAEEPSVAVVTGRVLGASGEPVAGVEVRLRDAAHAVDLQALSGPDGTFRIERVPAPGSYELVCVLGTRVEAGPRVGVARPGEVVAADLPLTLSLSESVSVTADAWTLPVDVPNSTSTRTIEQLRQQNLMNPEDALKYVPNTTIRKRYIGDRNALVGGRSFGTLQPSRGLVYLDGYLLSNFLGRFDAPRWNMVTPEALEKVDVLYGPFSAIHAGNSIGTTIVMTERTPRHVEWGMGLTGYSQSFGQYGESDTFNGGQLSAYGGTRFDSGLWGAITYNHQDSTSQPMQYYTVSANAAGLFPAVSGPATPVSGILYDRDPKDLDRAIFGANAGAIDHTRQDSVKLRLGYQITPSLEASAIVAGWHNGTENSNDTFLSDSAGAPVWQGRVTDGVHAFNVPPSAFAPSTHDELHRQLGATVRTHRPAGWNGSVIASDYRILDDATRQANNPDSVAAAGGAGTVTRRDGTGWNTFEVQGTYGEHAQDWGGGRHALTFGAHRNAYRLDNVVNDAADWRTSEDALSQRYQGRTEVIALYAQDAWALRDDLKLTLGWRAEWYETRDGEQIAFGRTVSYDRRSLSGQSPKASLAWTASDRWRLRASYGHGVRFPNVEELYNGTVTATSVTLSDPNLRPERGDAVELTAETFWSRQTLRTSLFLDDVKDAILRQSDTTVTPSITNVSNADRVRTPGVEFVWSARDLGLHGLSVEANAAFAWSKVVENAKDPASVGKYRLRVPRRGAACCSRTVPTRNGWAAWATATRARLQRRLTT
jgi:iron complex outermembrane receptor protein